MQDPDIPPRDEVLSIAIEPTCCIYQLPISVLNPKSAIAQSFLERLRVVGMITEQEEMVPVGVTRAVMQGSACDYRVDRYLEMPCSQDRRCVRDFSGGKNPKVDERASTDWQLRRMYRGRFAGTCRSSQRGRRERELRVGLERNAGSVGLCRTRETESSQKRRVRR